MIIPVKAFSNYFQTSKIYGRRSNMSHEFVNEPLLLWGLWVMINRLIIGFEKC
jgi:hypothetical protein